MGSKEDRTPSVRKALRFKLAWAAAFALSVTCRGGHRFDAQEQGTAVLSVADQPNPLIFPDLQNIDLEKNPQLTMQGIAASELTSVKLAQLTLEVADPPSRQDVTFLSSVDVFAGDPGGPLLAHGEGFAPGLSLVGLDVQDVELKEFFSGKDRRPLSFYVQANYANGGLPQGTLTLRARPTFELVTSKLQSFCQY